MLFQCPASFTPAPENIQRMRSFFERIERPNARLHLVRVVDPFVSPPHPGHSVYWCLQGPGSRASYDQAELKRLYRMLLDAGSSESAYVLFNNLPLVSDAKRFSAILRKTT